MLVVDPDRVAELEASGWRAYYDRRWLTLLRLIVTLCQHQFHIAERPRSRRQAVAGSATAGRGWLEWRCVSRPSVRQFRS